MTTNDRNGYDPYMEWSHAYISSRIDLAPEDTRLVDAFKGCHIPSNSPPSRRPEYLRSPETSLIDTPKGNSKQILRYHLAPQIEDLSVQGGVCNRHGTNRKKTVQPCGCTKRTRSLHSSQRKAQCKDTNLYQKIHRTRCVHQAWAGETFQS